MDLLIKSVLFLSMMVIVKVHSEGHWKILVKYYEPAHLTCGKNNTSTFDTSAEVNWILPSSDLVKITQEKMNFGHYSFMDYGKVLHIDKVNDEDFGVYICLVRLPNGEMEVFQNGVNVDGAYYGDMLTRYKPHMITGAIAAAVTFAAAAILCFFCNQHHARREKALLLFREENPGMFWKPWQPEGISSRIHGTDNPGLQVELSLEKFETVNNDVNKDDFKDKMDKSNYNTKM